MLRRHLQELVKRNNRSAMVVMQIDDALWDLLIDMEDEGMPTGSSSVRDLLVKRKESQEKALEQTKRELAEWDAMVEKASGQKPIPGTR